MYFSLMHRKMLFIINPIAGKKTGETLIPLIHKKLENKIEYEILLWKKIDDLKHLEQKLKNESFTDLIAVGGDGTVNLLGGFVIESEITLGIIPVGSGNGLARSLKIPLDPSMALDTIILNKTSLIDSGKINGHAFFCTAGLGFDAHIGKLFSKSIKRGLKSYVQIIIKEFGSYKSERYTLRYNGKSIDRTLFLITVANAGQYGNDFYIAPQANLNDGKFHVVLLKPFGFFSVLGIFLKIIRGKANESKFIDTILTEELEVERKEKGPVHFDGEPLEEDKIVKFKIYPRSLNVITGEKYTA